MRVPDRVMDGLVVSAFIAPVVGIALSIWTGEEAWLLLLFVTVLFL